MESNRNNRFRLDMLELANAIHVAYGAPYARATQYLRDSWLKLGHVE